MPQLLSSVEYAFVTDYAIAGVVQRGADPALHIQTQTFAASAPGMVALCCGTNSARVAMRLERWDGPPSPVDDNWEDRDLLPWQTLPDAHAVVGYGFDRPDPGTGLDLGELTAGRVEVLAIGRHRYSYADYDLPVTLPPEQWLLRWWPTRAPIDALSGPPRRIAGSLPFEARRTAWEAAIHSWSQRGWSAPLRERLSWSEVVVNALYQLGRPATETEIVTMFSQPDEARTRISEAITEMIGYGLLVCGEDPAAGLLVPNPAPRPAWEIFADADPDQVRSWRRQALDIDYRHLQGDIRHLLRWAPDGELTATCETLAIRLAVPPDDIRGCLLCMQLFDEIIVDGEFDTGSHAAPIVVRPGRLFRAGG